MLKLDRNILNTLLIVGAIFLGLSLMVSLRTPANANTEYVVVRAYVPVGSKGEIIIAYGSGKSERIEIEQLNSDHHEHNANRLVDVFDRLNEEGYTIASAGSAGAGNSASLLQVETYVFHKKVN